MDKLKEKTIEYEKSLILEAISKSSNITEAANFLGCKRPMLSQKIKRYNIVPKFLCRNCECKEITNE